MKVLNCITRTFITLISGTITTAIFLSMAYAERGYFGIGGEWLLIIAAVALAWRYSADFADYILKGDEPSGEKTVR